MSERKIHRRRISTLGRQFFMTAFLVWSKDDEGRLFANATSVSREAMSDLLRDHGVAALRRFIKAIWLRLEDKLFTDGQHVKSECDSIDIRSMEWQHEEF